MLHNSIWPNYSYIIIVGHYYGLCAQVRGIPSACLLLPWSPSSSRSSSSLWPLPLPPPLPPLPLAVPPISRTCSSNPLLLIPTTTHHPTAGGGASLELQRRPPPSPPPRVTGTLTPPSRYPHRLAILPPPSPSKHAGVSCVFDGAAPNLAEALILAGEERLLWSMAGARGLSFLTGLLPGS